MLVDVVEIVDGEVRRCPYSAHVRYREDGSLMCGNPMKTPDGIFVVMIYLPKSEHLTDESVALVDLFRARMAAEGKPYSTC